MYEFLGTAITNYYKLGGLEQQKFVLSQLQRPQVCNQNVSKATLPPKCLGKVLFFGSSSFWWLWCPLACSHVNQFPYVFVSSYVSQIPLCLSVSLFLRFICLFTYFWLFWVFIAVLELSLVALSRGYSSVQRAGFSLQWLLLLHSTGCRCVGFSTWRQGGSVIVAPGF